MDLLSLLLFGIINVAMVLSYLLGGKSRFYQFPFWVGMIALGWFLPQAVGGYFNVSGFPENAYADGMLFATLCTVAVWLSFAIAASRTPKNPSWLDALFDVRRLYWVGVAFCVFGFFFQWKLWSLPEEMLAESQWSGEAVKYLFLANIFKFGLLTLWLLYLSQPKWMPPKLMAFIIPCLGFVLYTALLRGRRSEMMNIVAYLVVSMWFVRRIAIPRWLLISGLILGLVLINGIKIYRSIMMDTDTPLMERLEKVVDADYLSVTGDAVRESGAEFENYIMYRYIYAEQSMFDYGGSHWNKFIFNYVPAQIVGRDVKESLMIEKLREVGPKEVASEMLGYSWRTGTTSTGYADAFGSFGWFGFIKFLLIGGIMGTLYRHAIDGSFLGQFLYSYVLTMGMQSVTHGTNAILIRAWAYFFILCYPFLLWARAQAVHSVVNSRSKYVSSV